MRLSELLFIIGLEGKFTTRLSRNVVEIREWIDASTGIIQCPKTPHIFAHFIVRKNAMTVGKNHGRQTIM